MTFFLCSLNFQKDHQTFYICNGQEHNKKILRIIQVDICSDIARIFFFNKSDKIFFLFLFMVLVKQNSI